MKGAENVIYETRNDRAAELQRMEILKMNHPLCFDFG